MASGINGAQILRANYGIPLYRAAAVLPATGNQTLFTITGGKVLVTNLCGEVTTVMSGTATNAKLTLVGTVLAGAGTDITANVAVTSLAVGNVLCVSTFGSAMAVGAAANQVNEFTCMPGIIRLTTDATNTGAVKWSLTYVPLDPGAQVVVS
jgi:hypothetical protein